MVVAARVCLTACRLNSKRRRNASTVGALTNVSVKRSGHISDQSHGLAVAHLHAAIHCRDHGRRGSRTAVRVCRHDAYCTDQPQCWTGAGNTMLRCTYEEVRLYYACAPRCYVRPSDDTSARSACASFSVFLYSEDEWCTHVLELEPLIACNHAHRGGGGGSQAMSHRSAALHAAEANRTDHAALGAILLYGFTICKYGRRAQLCDLVRRRHGHAE